MKLADWFLAGMIAAIPAIAWFDSWLFTGTQAHFNYYLVQTSAEVLALICGYVIGRCTNP